MKVLTTDDKISYLLSDNCLKKLTQKQCNKDQKIKLSEKGKIMDLIHFLRCRYETAYLFSPPKEELVNNKTLYEANNSSVYRIRDKLSELILKDHAPENEDENKEYDLSVKTAKKLYSDIIHEIFMEQSVIQPFLISEKNTNFTAFYGYFMCKSHPFIRPGQPVCSHSDENKTVKLYSLYEYINGSTVTDLIENKNKQNIQNIQTLYDIFLQVFGNLWMIQNDNIIYNHNDLHSSNVMVQTLSEPITHNVKGYEWSSNLRVVVIDQGLASCVFKKRDCKALSWYRERFQNFPDDLSGFDVFRLTTYIFQKYLLRKNLDNIQTEIFKEYKDILLSFFEKYGWNSEWLLNRLKEQDIYPEHIDGYSKLFPITYESFFMYIYRIYKGDHNHHNDHNDHNHDINIENLPDIPSLLREESEKQSMFKGLQSLFKDLSHSDHSDSDKHSDKHSHHSDHSDKHSDKHSHHSKHSDHSDHSDKHSDKHSHHSDHSDKHSHHSDHSDHSDRSHHSDHSDKHSHHSDHSYHSGHSNHSDCSVHSDHSGHSSSASDRSLNDLNKESINKLIRLLKKQENIEEMKRKEEKIIIHKDEDDK